MLHTYVFWERDEDERHWTLNKVQSKTRYGLFSMVLYLYYLYAHMREAGAFPPSPPLRGLFPAPEPYLP